MPKPTLQNRNHWKQYIRTFKDKWTSNIQDIPFQYLDEVISTVDSNITGTDNIKVVVFDNKEYVGITTIFNNNDLIYLPGVKGDTINLGIGTGNYKLKFLGDADGISYNGTTYQLNDKITLPGQNKAIVIKGLGGGLIQAGDPPPQPTYSLSQTATSINEGGSVGFTLSTANVDDATTLYYTLSGSATADDFVGGTLAGSFIINNNTGNFNVIVTGDSVTEYTETFTAYIRTGSTSGPIVATSSQVTIGDVAQTVSIAPSVTAVNEGQQVTFTITSTGYSPTSTFYYDIVGTTTAEDFTDNTLTGTFSTTNNTYSLIKVVKSDNISDDGETFVVNIRTGSNSGTIVATSPTITINDVAQAVTITQNTTNPNETHNELESADSGLVTFTISTTGYSAGTILYWTTLSTAGEVTAADFHGSAINGTFQLDSSGQGTIQRRVKSDRLTEGIEKFKLQIRTDSTSGSIIATSDEITINDISLTVGALANGKTFGPVQVNRDNGNTSLASDWYTICNIDGIPEGSKIAMFIDNSGSMTTSVVQASYDAFVEKLNARGITIITVENPNEDWITPFLTELA